MKFDTVILYSIQKNGKKNFQKCSGRDGDVTNYAKNYEIIYK